MHIKAISEDFSFTGESLNKIHKFSSNDKNYFRRTTTELDQRRAYKAPAPGLAMFLKG